MIIPTITTINVNVFLIIYQLLLYFTVKFILTNNYKADSIKLHNNKQKQKKTDSACLSRTHGSFSQEGSKAE